MCFSGSSNTELIEMLSLQKFLNKVEEAFLCICCQEVVFRPVTTVCQHNVCKVSWALLGWAGAGAGAGAASLVLTGRGGLFGIFARN